MLFEWDEDKRDINFEKHGVDFLDAMEIWQGDVVEFPSPQSEHGEHRLIALGTLPNDERVLLVVFVWRDEKRRLISARRANTNERQAYRHATGRGR